MTKRVNVMHPYHAAIKEMKRKGIYKKPKAVKPITKEGPIKLEPVVERPVIQSVAYSLVNFDLNTVDFRLQSISTPCGSFEYTGDAGDEPCEFTVSLEIFAKDVCEVQVKGITLHHCLDDYSDDNRFIEALAKHVGAIVRSDVKLSPNQNIDDGDLMLFDMI